MNADYILWLTVYFNISEDIRSREVRGTRGNKKHGKPAQILLNSAYLRHREFIGCQKHYWTLALKPIIIENQSFYFTLWSSISHSCIALIKVYSHSKKFHTVGKLQNQISKSQKQFPTLRKIICKLFTTHIPNFLY